MLRNLASWYSSKTKRQINVLRLTAFILAAFPMIGWIFIAPWMIPLMLYLEYHLKPSDTE